MHIAVRCLAAEFGERLVKLALSCTDTANKNPSIFVNQFCGKFLKQRNQFREVSLIHEASRNI